ncbi:glutathione S-transferase family protein [Granulosicoccus antarcticus]|uniref:Glutathione S-transferase GstA n=1 Tax=Granulosicoccus antarcticus IMCC3135 TaxID=1192854 RepID=A0A2Z2NJK4_9GAMM|nr:glutathione S-transferase family protein [Granulosicoccus antarcticus]ASJ70685.1 Glutathione S-transferase GstA [Granulosicoccus antarcticus IMCC3135]
MSTDNTITLFYSPQTRAAGIRVILEELGASYDLHVLNMKVDENHDPDFLAINPLGKVPTIRHHGTVITEQVAIAIYLGDLFPDARLAPAIDDPQRGTYLRWLVYYAACFEPALMDKFTQNEVTDTSQSVYGDFDTMLATLETALADGPWFLGERMSVADILWGIALNWTMTFKLIPERPVFREYADRVTARAAFIKVAADDERLAAAHQAVVDQRRGEC